MNVCKVLDLTPGLEMTSWGTVHFPEEGRIMEWVVNVIRGKWRSMRYGPCQRAPEGGLREIEAGQRAYLEAFKENEPAFKAQMICKEGLSDDEAVKLILGELSRAEFPHSLQSEVEKLQIRLELCRAPSPTKAPRRFRVEGRGR